MIMDSSPANTLSALARFAWCGLVALRLAEQEGRTVSQLQQHLFLTQWLTTAQKQKRFPKCIASDMNWLLSQGKKYGLAARLAHKLDYLYRSSSGVLAQQSDLFRLTYCIETLKSMGWQYEPMATPQPRKPGSRKHHKGRAVHVAKTLLENSYNDEGKLLTPISLHFTGDISGVPALLEQCHIPYQRAHDVNGLAVVTLLPGEIRE